MQQAAVDCKEKVVVCASIAAIVVVGTAPFFVFLQALGEAKMSM